MTNTAWGTLACVPETAGAYAVLLDVRTPRRLPQRLKPPMLPPGRFLYAGSARGPGGLRARLARHLRRQKPRHWHLDWLTSAPPALVRICGFATFETAGECDLVDWLKTQTAAPITGFGASDCRRCAAHLVGLDAGPRLDKLVEALGGTLIWSRDTPRLR